MVKSERPSSSVTAPVASCAEMVLLIKSASFASTCSCQLGVHLCSRIMRHGCVPGGPARCTATVSLSTASTNRSNSSASHRLNVGLFNATLGADFKPISSAANSKQVSPIVVLVPRSSANSFNSSRTLDSSAACLRQASSD